MPAEAQVEIPLVFPAQAAVEQPELSLAQEAQAVSWSTRAVQLEKAIAAAGAAVDEKYADRNLLIVQMWSDRSRGDHEVVKRICRYAKTNESVVQWVLKMARKGAYDRLVKKARAGRRGRRQEILAALRSGVSPSEVERQFQLHRTTVLRAQHQLRTTQKTAA